MEMRLEFLAASSYPEFFTVLRRLAEE